jgi:hypothetical protein
VGDGLVATPLRAADGEVGASRIFGSTIESSPNPVSPGLNILGSVEVSIDAKAACRALVDADGETLATLDAAPAAILRCTSWIHGDPFPSGAFGLGGEYRPLLRPRGVVHLLGEAHLCQAFDVEVLQADAIKPAHEVDRGLVMEVESDPTHAIVLLREKRDGLATPRSTTLTPRDSALRHGERSLRPWVRSLVIDRRAVAERSQRRDAHVDTDTAARGRQRFDGHAAARERDVPMTVSAKRDGRLLDRADDGPVQLDLDATDARELDALAAGDTSHAVAVGGVLERERPIPALALESREAGSLARFDAPEESAIRAIEPCDRILQEICKRGV